MEKNKPSPAFTWFLITVFLLMVTGILASGLLFYRSQQNRIKDEAHRNLTAIADLKVGQIVQWRYERLGDAELISKNAPLVRQIEGYFKNPNTPNRKQELLSIMKSLQDNQGYESVLLIDTKGDVRLAKSPHGDSVGSHAKGLFSEIQQNRKILFSDFHTSEVITFPHLDLAIPLFSPDRTDSVIIGIMLLRIDPRTILYPIMRAWPIISRTSETLLLRKGGEDVVFLNELRHQKYDPLTLRLPINDEQLPAAMAVRGIEGVVEGLDYRGIPVLAALKPIHNSPWFMVAKVDREEIYAPLREQAWWVGGGMFLSILASGATLGFGWRHQRARFYKERYEAELEKQALTKHFEYLIKYANDIIILADENTKIIDANDSALKIYGYTYSEVLSLHLKDFRAPETSGNIQEVLDRVKTENGILYETIHRRKDGSKLFVEVSLRMIEINGINFYQAIIRDISERKMVEEVLSESTEEIQDLYNNAPCGYHTLDKDGIFTRVNDTELKWLGYTREELIGLAKFTDILTSKSINIFNHLYPDFIEQGFLNNVEFEIFKKDGTILPVSLNATVIKDHLGCLIMNRSTIYDITDRKDAEQKILRLNRTYAVISNINQMVVRKRDRQAIFEEACRIAVEDGRFRMAWIGLLDKNNGSVVPISKAGLIADYFDNLHITTENQPLGRGPTGTAIREGKHIICNNIATDESMAPWRERAISLGYLSVGAFPIIVFNNVIGAISLYADEVNFFDKEEIHLLDELALDMGYALELLELDEKRRQAEKSLAQSVSLLQATLESTADGILVVDLTGKITGYNNQFTKMWNIPEGIINSGDDNQAINHVLNQLKDPDSFLKKVKELYTRTEMDSFDILEFKDGKIFERYSHPQQINGQPVGRVWSFRNVTQRNQTEEALRESEERNRNLAEGTFEGIVISVDGKIVECNNQLASLLGYRDPSELIDSTVQNFVAPESLALVKEAIRSGKTELYEHIAIRKDGSRLVVETRGRMLNYRGKLARMTAIRDITAQKEAEKILLESEDQFRSLAEQSPNMIFINYNGIVVYANKRCEEIMGYSKEEFYAPGFNFLKLIADEHHDAIRNNFKRHMQRIDVQPIEYKLVTKEGRQINTILSTKLISYKGDMAILGTATDITEHKNVEKALRDSEALFKMLVESSPMAIAVFSNPSQKIEYVSRRFTELFGYVQADIPSVDAWLPLAYPEELYRDNVIAVWQEALRRELQNITDFEPIESIMTCKDGSSKYIESLLTSIGDQTLIFFSDLTQRRTTEEALRQTHAFNDLLIQTMPFGMSIVDQEGKILFMSKKMKEMIGNDIIDQCCWQVYKDDHQQCTGCPLHREISFDHPESLETTGVFGNKTFQISHIGLMYNGRKAMLEVFQDITEQKKLQQELLQSQKLLSIGTMAGGIAHDFNNILGIILGYISILYSVKDNQQRFSDGVSAIKQAVDRGAGLVRQILTFARKTDVSFEPLSIPDLVKELVSMLEQTFSKLITFNLRLAKGLPYINADHAQIHQALLNLCVNSRDAMPNGGEITIQVDLIQGEQLRERFPEAVDNWYEIVSVSDTGLGIDEATRSRIFDPFFTTKEKGKGTGLGLSVVYGIVKTHHGFLDVESVVEGGTTFKLYFPVPKEIGMSISKGFVEKKMPGGSETVLIVEDEELLLQMVQILLETHGYTVIMAKDGQEAVDIYSKNTNKIDIVLSDMGLPKITGIEEFEKMKEINPEVKVIFASGFFDPEIKSVLEEAGAMGFLQKPYIIEELLTKVREALDEKDV